MVDTGSIATANVAWRPAHRIVASRFPPVGPWDRIARPEEIGVHAVRDHPHLVAQGVIKQVAILRADYHVPVEQIEHQVLVGDQAARFGTQTKLVFPIAQ